MIFHKQNGGKVASALTEIATKGPKLEYNAKPEEEIYVPLTNGWFIPK